MRSLLFLSVQPSQMTINNFDPIAVWYFNSDKFSPFYELSDTEFGCYSIEIFWNVKKALEILYRYEILKVNRMKFLRKKGLIIENIQEDSVDSIMDIIIQNVNEAGASPHIIFSGKTTLLQNGHKRTYDQIVNLYCCLIMGTISITLLSDCWVPIDRNDELQIELAEDSSKRLFQTLNEIKELGFDNIDPDINEENGDELLPQFGFKVYLHDTAIDYINFDELSAEEKKTIEKYLWKNRKEFST